MNAEIEMITHLNMVESDEAESPGSAFRIADHLYFQNGPEFLEVPSQVLFQCLVTVTQNVVNKRHATFF